MDVKDLVKLPAKDPIKIAASANNLHNTILTFKAIFAYHCDHSFR